jgi:hypothetical protein
LRAGLPSLLCAALDPVHAKHVAAGHGIFRAPIVTRTREIKKNRVDVRIVPLTRFGREQLRCIDDAAERYGEFLGLAAEVNKG